MNWPPTRRAKLVLLLGPGVCLGLWYASTWAWRSLVHPPSDYREVDLKALGFFDFDQESGAFTDVPQRWRELEGKRVRMQGFMFAPDSAAGPPVTFQLVYNVARKWGGPPRVQERIFCTPAPGDNIRAYDMSTFVEASGVLHVRVRRDGSGAIRSVYDMDVEQVTPVAPAPPPPPEPWLAAWHVAAAAYVPVAGVLLADALRRRRRRRAGRLAACGYDLRAVPEGGGPLLPRCPECGRLTNARRRAERMQWDDRR